MFVTSVCQRRGPRDARGINGEGPRRVKILTTPCRLLCHYLPAAQNVLATIWPLIEILRSLVDIGKLESRHRAIMPRCLRHPTFSRFSRTATCDGHRQTDTRPLHIPRRAYLARQKMSVWFMSVGNFCFFS